MSVTSDYAPVREAGNGVKVAFDANFPVIQTTDVKVGKILNSTNVKTDMVYGVDYTVTINAANKRPTVTYVVAPTALQDSWIGREVPNTQTATIPTNNIFREVQVNNALDKHTMVDQQLEAQLARCAKVPEISTAVVVLPEPEDGKVPAWDGVAGVMRNADIDPLAIADAVTAAEAAQGLAETAQTAAETAQGLAEAAQVAAEAAQVAAEAAAASVPSLSTFLQAAFPIGCTYVSYLSTSPATLFGFGTWAACGVGRIWVGLNAADADFDTVGEQGGAKTHTLTTNEMPTTVPVSVSADAAAAGVDRTTVGALGGGAAFSIMPPTEVVYKWKRTA